MKSAGPPQSWRAGARAAGASGIGLAGFRLQPILDANFVAPRDVKVIFVGKSCALAEPQRRQRDVGRGRRQLPRAVPRRAQTELVEVDALPPHRDLDYAVQLTERKSDGDQNAPPNHRADPKQPNLDLHDSIDALRGRVIIPRKGLLRTSLHPTRLPPLPQSLPVPKKS
jgi:hypothetical protein